MEKHELFEELDSFNPTWQAAYPTLRAAAAAARVEYLYWEYLATPEGKAYRLRLQGVPDFEAQNARARKQHAADLRMANESRKGR